jgi:hypothetical protein
MGRGFMNGGAAGAELRTAQDIPAANDDCQLTAQPGSMLRLSRDLQNFVHTDSALTRVVKTLARELQ